MVLPVLTRASLSLVETVILLPLSLSNDSRHYHELLLLCLLTYISHWRKSRTPNTSSSHRDHSSGSPYK